MSNPPTAPVLVAGSTVSTGLADGQLAIANEPAISLRTSRLGSANNEMTARVARRQFDLAARTQEQDGHRRSARPVCYHADAGPLHVVAPPGAPRDRTPAWRAPPGTDLSAALATRRLDQDRHLPGERLSVACIARCIAEQNSAISSRRPHLVSDATVVAPARRSAASASSDRFCSVSIPAQFPDARTNAPRCGGGQVPTHDSPIHMALTGHSFPDHRAAPTLGVGALASNLSVQIQASTDARRFGS